MSLEENKEIVRRYQEAYNKQGYDALAEVVAPDVLTPNMISSMPRGPEGIIVALAEQLGNQSITDVLGNP